MAMLPCIPQKGPSSTAHSSNHGAKVDYIVIILREEDKLPYSATRRRCHSFTFLFAFSYTNF